MFGRPGDAIESLRGSLSTASASSAGHVSDEWIAAVNRMIDYLEQDAP